MLPLHGAQVPNLVGELLIKVIKIMRWGIFLDYLDHSGIFTESLYVGPGRAVVEEKVAR